MFHAANINCPECNDPEMYIVQQTYDILNSNKNQYGPCKKCQFTATSEVEKNALLTLMYHSKFGKSPGQSNDFNELKHQYMCIELIKELNINLNASDIINLLTNEIRLKETLTKLKLKAFW